MAATGGLFNYAPASRIAAAAVEEPFERAMGALVGLVRLPGGALQDDVAIALLARIPRRDNRGG